MKKIKKWKLTAAILTAAAMGILTACSAPTGAKTEVNTEETGKGNFTDEMKIPYAVNLDDQGASAVERKGDHPDSPYFSSVDFYNAENTDSLTILPHFKTTQQTTWWSCGVSATQMVMNYYDRLGDWNEETLAALRDDHNDIHMGTCLDQVIEMFEKAGGFELETTYDYQDNLDAVNLAFIKDHIKQGIPVIVGWNDWSGHWQVIIGYDDMGTEYEGDDVIIVADSFDTTDHNQDGYGVYGGERFIYNFTFFDFFGDNDHLRDKCFVAVKPAEGKTTAKGPDELTEKASKLTIETMKKAMGIAVETAETGKKVAVVRNLDYDDHTTQFFDGAVSEGKKLGYTVDTFVTGADDEKMQETLKKVIADGYDGIIVSHGKEAYSGELIQEAADKGIQVVTFDTVFQPIEGVTATAQDDEQLAKLSLDALLASIDKKPAKIVKVWYDKNMSPFSRRNAVFEEYEKQGLIEMAAEIYPEVPAGELKAEVTKQMKELNVEADGVWAVWDELAQGVYDAETGMPMGSIDISDEDIKDMTAKPESWVATAAVNARTIGQVDMRILDKKFKGEETPAVYELEGSLIKASDLNQDSKVETLDVGGFQDSAAFAD